MRGPGFGTCWRRVSTTWWGLEGAISGCGCTTGTKVEHRLEHAIRWPRSTRDPMPCPSVSPSPPCAGVGHEGERRGGAGQAAAAGGQGEVGWPAVWQPDGKHGLWTIGEHRIATQVGSNLKSGTTATVPLRKHDCMLGRALWESTRQPQPTCLTNHGAYPFTPAPGSQATSWPEPAATQRRRAPTRLTHPAYAPPLLNTHAPCR